MVLDLISNLDISFRYPWIVLIEGQIKMQPQRASGVSHIVRIVLGVDLKVLAVVGHLGEAGGAVDQLEQGVLLASHVLDQGKAGYFQA